MDCFQECGSYTLSDADTRVENWQKGFNKLEADDYMTEISAEILEIRGKIITQMDFSNNTLFSNVLLIMSNCTNLRKVSFHNTLLQVESDRLDDGYRRLNNHNDAILLPKLDTLTFTGFGPLTSSELFLLGFFTVEVTMPSLETLNFVEGCHHQTPSKTCTCDKQDSKFKDILLLKFLAKVGTSLKKLRIKRSPFVLIAEEEGGERLGGESAGGAPPPDVAHSTGNRMESRDSLITSLRSCQLNHLVAFTNCKGIDVLIDLQENLELLYLDSSIPNSFQGVCTQKLLATVETCIYNCSQTLAIVIAPGAVAVPETETGDENQGLKTPISHDMSMYSGCKSLIYLTLDKLFVGEGETLVGTFTSASELPTSLMQISILVDHVDEWEFQYLLERLSSMTYLRDLELKSIKPYYIKQEGFDAIFKISRCTPRALKFLHGFLDNGIVPQKAVSARAEDEEGRKFPNWSITLNEKGTLFYC